MLNVRISAEYNGRTVLRDVAFSIAPGEVLGLIGESGSGKSTVALSLLRLLDMRGGSTSGRVELNGQNLLTLPRNRMRELRGGQIGFVCQTPVSALNSSLRLGSHLKEAWRAHASGTPDFAEILRSVSLTGDPSFLKRYPGELSVGQGQRFLIAMAILHRPALLIADEPTSALDVITQSEILALFGRLSRERGMGVLFISHDLLSVSAICHRVAILCAGEIVETGDVARIFRSPAHPYTRRLVAAIPRHPAGLLHC